MQRKNNFFGIGHEQFVYTFQQQLCQKMNDQMNSNGTSQILQLSELSLFQEDPFIEEISVIQEQPEPIDQSMYLLNGEKILHKHPCRVQIEGDSLSFRGQFEAYASNYRIILFSNLFHKPRKSTQKQQKKQIPVSIPFAIMNEIDLVKREIVLKLKTGLTFKLKPEMPDLQNLYQHFLKGYMAIPFFSINIFQQEESLTYDCLAQMQRIRMNWTSLIIVNNSAGQNCPTYPKYFVVPKKVESNLLEECLKIRNGNRIPVATYYWNDHKTALWRGSKVKANLQNNKFNQAYLKEISRDLTIIDLNEQFASREPKSMRSINYSFKFMSNQGLNNLFQKIIVSYSKNEQIFKIIERWFEDISSIIKCAYLTVYELKKGNHVLLEESSGIDRTCQVAALVQLIIDPFYRTINGFSILVEKEFVSFGHPFNYRLGFEREKQHEESPIFIQFLQCVSQLIVTHPKCFEFSSYFLARIAYEAFTAKYNNFFFNDQELKKRYDNILKTPNIWKHLPMMKQYYNYQWQQKQAVKYLISVRTMPSIKEYLVWKQFYDMVVEMRCEEPRQIHVKKRRSSIYKMFRKMSIKTE